MKKCESARFGVLAQSELTTVRVLRNYLIRNGGKVRARRRTPQNLGLCERMEGPILSLRAARLAMKEEMPGGWLRAVRQATGIPVYVLAKRLGVTKHEIFRLEKAESSSRIMLANLKRAAEALGCDLVYGLVPRKGSLKDLAAVEVSMREAAQELVEQKRTEQANAPDDWTDIYGSLRRAMRRQLRKQRMRFW